jgi:hypothetical protein
VTFPAGHNPQQAADTPDLDDWGSDSWWTWQDWATWHGAMVKAYGKAAADARWIKFWCEQSTGAGPLNDRSANSAFRKWAKGNGLIEAFYCSVSWVAPVGVVLSDLPKAATNIAQNTIEAADEAAGSALWVVKHPWLTLGGVLVLGLGALVVVRKVQGTAAASAVGMLAR